MHSHPGSSELPDCKDKVAQKSEVPAFDNRYKSDRPLVCFVGAVDAGKLLPVREMTGFMHKPECVIYTGAPPKETFQSVLRSTLTEAYTTHLPSVEMLGKLSPPP